MMLYCGWDGGGTHTTVLVSDHRGQTVAQASFGPLNMNGNPKSVVTETVKNAVAFMKAQGECCSLIVGMAGVSNRDAVAFITKQIRAAGYKGDLRIVGDQEIALEGAIRKHGAVLIAGTGSVCCGRNEAGDFFRTGGYGWIIDDLGSGYAIGHDILMAAVRDEDGRGPATCLKQMVLNEIGAEDVRGLITWLYSSQVGKKEIASLAPLLQAALDKKDPAAEAIADKAAADLRDMVTALWHKAGMEDGELVYGGSILKHYPIIAQKLTLTLADALPSVRVVQPHGTPAEGAVKLALKQLPPHRQLNREAAEGVMVRIMQQEDIPGVLALLRRYSMIGDVLWDPADEKWIKQYLLHDDRIALTARDQEKGIVGFSLAAMGNGAKPEAFLSMLLVSLPMRMKGIGTALLQITCELARQMGAEKLRISSASPVPVPWHLPKNKLTHNCIPGVPKQGIGRSWLLHMGFTGEGSSVVMARKFNRTKDPRGRVVLRDDILKDPSIQVKEWAPGDPTEVDTLCDHVGSDYWRHVLKTELKAWHSNTPNEDPALWPDGRRPNGPRPLIVAIADNRIVGFTGPLDLQESGRGWFTGICVDPDYGRRGVGETLFNRLLKRFEDMGADHITLYTGENNPARHIYERAGLKVAVQTYSMGLALKEEE